MTPEVVSALGSVREHRGRQELYKSLQPATLEKLCEVAKIQSTGASNRIENISTSEVRLRELMQRKVAPANRDEREIAGYRYVLDMIHERHDGIPVTPIRAMHYKLPVLGFRFGDCAYVTDANYIPETEFDKLKGLEIFVLNTVKRGHHISHYALEEAVEVCRRVGARRSYLTHLSHMLPRHAALTEELASLPFSLRPAYDGLTVAF